MTPRSQEQSGRWGQLPRQEELEKEVLPASFRPTSSDLLDFTTSGALDSM